MRLVMLVKGRMKALKMRVEEFLKDNPKPKDEQVHKLAGELGLEPDKLEEVIYGLLAEKTGAGEKAPGRAGQLKMGVKVEMEHLPTIRKLKDYVERAGSWPSNKEIARWIASDHLSELPDYYTRLARMERGADA